jgi:hypothetical protein
MYRATTIAAQMAATVPEIVDTSNTRSPVETHAAAHYTVTARKLICAVGILNSNGVQNAGQNREINIGNRSFENLSQFKYL